MTIIPGSLLKDSLEHELLLRSGTLTTAIDNLSQVIKDRGTDKERTAAFDVVIESGDEFLRFLQEHIRPNIIGGDSYTDAMESYVFSIRGMFKPGWKHDKNKSGDLELARQGLEDTTGNFIENVTLGGGKDAGCATPTNKCAL
jgi:hypothetical protein